MSEFEGQPERTNITVSQATQADIDRQFLEHGEGNNSGRAPTYKEQWGITASAPGEPFASGPSIGQLEVEAAQAMERAVHPTPIQGPGATVTETQTVEIPNAELINYQDDQLNVEQRAKKYQLLHGNGENEKGELRRELQETNDTLNMVIAQMQAAKAQQPQYPQSQPQFDPNFQPQFQPQQQAQGVDYFKDAADDDYISAKDARKFQYDAQATMAMMYNQNMAAQQQLHQMQSQVLEQRKAAVGLTPVEEYKLTAKNPWVSSLPDGPQKTEAILGLWSQRQPTVPMPDQPVAPQAPTPMPSQVAQNVVRKVTYSEPSQPSTAELTQNAVQSLHDKDMAIAMAAPLVDPVTGVTRAQRMRDVAAKHNYQLGDGGLGVISR